MSSPDLTVATRLVNEIQGEVEDFNVRMVAVYPYNETGYVVRLRLMGKTQIDTSFDSSFHREVARTIRRMYPLTTVACERNALDDENEILVTVPNTRAAWKLTSSRIKSTKMDRLFEVCHWVLSIALVTILFPRFEEYVISTWGFVQTALGT